MTRLLLRGLAALALATAATLLFSYDHPAWKALAFAGFLAAAATLAFSDLRRAWPGLLSAALLWCAFPPWDLGFLAWVALVPWAVMIERHPARGQWWHSCLAGHALAFAMMFFLHQVTVGGYVLGAVITGLWLSLTGPFIKRLRAGAGLPMSLALPLGWVGVEFLRDAGPAPFPWFFLGYSQWRFGALLQSADLWGEYGLSFLVAGANGALVDALGAARRRDLSPAARNRAMARALAWPAMLVAGASLYGAARGHAIDMVEGPRLALVQGNIPQDAKESGQARDQVFDQHMALSYRAVEEGRAAGAPVAAIVWPETMTPENPAFSRYRPSLEHLARHAGAHVVVGGICSETAEGGRRVQRNSLFHFGPEGGLRARWDKCEMVPGSENVPLKGLFPWFEPVVFIWFGMVPDLEPKLAAMPNFVLDGPGGGSVAGPLICYDSAFQYVTEQEALATDPGPADFFLCASNDGWFTRRVGGLFDQSCELEQITIMTLFRAVESRRGVARGTNTGITSFIDPVGAVRALEVEGARKNVAGCLVGAVRTSRAATVYLLVGRFARHLIFAALIGGLVVAWWRGRRLHAPD